MPPLRETVVRHPKWVPTLTINDSEPYVLPCDALDPDERAEEWRRNGILPDIDWVELFKVMRNA